MISIINKEDCCGCGACVQRCPKDCISLLEDEEGFLYPKVDKDTCIECGLCEKVCPVVHQSTKRVPLHVYAAKNKNEQIRLKSSSGGIFTQLSEYVISQGGVVFGAKFNDKWDVVHSYTDSIDGLSAFRGSKYAQSIVGNTYAEVKEFLRLGRLVLYSGTPCQIAGLKRYLRTIPNTLILVDFVCHGVPSPMVWQKYLAEVTDNLKKQFSKRAIYSNYIISPKIANIQFRDKTNGWIDYGLLIEGDLGLNLHNSRLELCENIICENDRFTFYEKFSDNLYLSGFIADIFLRPSCYKCSSKEFKSGSDITIADYWGIRDIHPDFFDEKGVSLLYINTLKGESVWGLLDVDKLESTFDNAIKRNGATVRSVLRPEGRDMFFPQLAKGRSVASAVTKIMNPPTIVRIKRAVLRRLTRFVQKIV